MLRLENVRKVYSLGGADIRAVDGVDLEVAEGEVVALLGPSGSGKSTLLHLLGALDTPTSGRVLVGGKDIGAMDGVERARYRNRNVGFVFQSFYLQSHRTALENVEVPLEILGVPRRARREMARAQLEAVGLGDRLDHRPTELSGGQQQRVSIARALVTRPRILLADEPTGNLDSATGHEIVDLFLRLHRETGLTLALVTHDPELAGRAGRVLRVRDGKIVSDERPAGAPPAVPPAAVDRPEPEASVASRAADLGRAVFLGMRRHKVRTALTAVGIAIGAFAIALMVGLGLGLHEFIVTQAEAINDPLSLRVVNASFSFDDVFGDQVENMARAPVPLKEKTFERLAQLRAGYEPFKKEQIEELKSIEGVVSVRPRTFVVADGARLVEAGAERGEAGEKDGAPGEFPETYWLAYCLVRAAGTPFHLAAGAPYRDDDERSIILSYQYVQAWGLGEPEDLVGRELEILFPSLGQYSEWNWTNPDQVQARYRAFRARVAGVTQKSILACGLYLSPAFGEEVAHFQFGGKTGRMAEGGGQDPLTSAATLLELVRLVGDPALETSLRAGTEKERQLADALAALRAPPREGSPANPMAKGFELLRIRGLLEDAELKATLQADPGPKGRLVSLLAPILGRREGGEEEESYGSVLRVRVRNLDEVDEVRARVEAKGYRVRTLQEDLEAVGRIFAVVDVFLSSFGLIALFVASIGIANTLLMTVMERTQEIGLLKALGATRARIRRLFAFEAAAIGAVGGVAGCALAAAVGSWIDAYGIGMLVPEWAGFPFYRAPLWLLAGTLAFSSIVGLLAGLYPAARAARLDPIAALRSD